MVILNFYDKECSETHMEVSATNDNCLSITIEGNGIMSLKLDKDTAIRLSKEIRKQISFLED